MPWNWRRLFFYQTEKVRATWLLRVLLLLGVGLVVVLCRGLWIPAISRTLVCNEAVRRSDAILIDNFEVNYLVFERAEQLKRAGIAPRVLVPTGASTETTQLEPSRVFAGIAEVMARVARLADPELIPVREVEPIALNAAYQLRDFLQGERVRSVVIVSPAFRSRRSALVYDAVFGAAGIRTSCVPVFRPNEDPATWIGTMHGIQEVLEQEIKLLYYRAYVMPYLADRSS